MIGVFLDTETNGLNYQIHKVIEVAYIIVDLTTGEVKDRFQTVVKQSPESWEKRDRQSVSINGFTWEEVSQGKDPEEVAKEVIAAFHKWGVVRKKAIFICQNPSFDRAFFAQIIDPDKQESLNWPYHWLDLASMYWSLAIQKAKLGEGPLPWETGCSKDTIAQHYKIPTEEKPHRAMNGASHLLKCYESVVGFARSVEK